MTGYVRGTLADPGGADELLRTAEQSLQVAEQLDRPRLNVHGTGLDDKGLPVVASEVVTPAMGCMPPEPRPGSPSWAGVPGGSSPWRTSTPPSTTPAPRSREPPTPSPSSRPSAAHIYA